MTAGCQVTSQQLVCGYCGHLKSSRSAGKDGRVRARCPCGGKHQDGMLRMHANWEPVEVSDKSPNPQPEGSATGYAATQMVMCYMQELCEGAELHDMINSIAYMKGEDETSSDGEKQHARVKVRKFKRRKLLGPVANNAESKLEAEHTDASLTLASAFSFGLASTSTIDKPARSVPQLN